METSSDLLTICCNWEDVDLPEELESMGGSFYIHEALQLRWAVIGVEDARKARICGNEHASTEAAKEGS